MGKTFKDLEKVSLPPREPLSMELQGAVGPGLSDGCEELNGGQDVGLLYTRVEDRPLRGPFTTSCWRSNASCYEAFMQSQRTDQAVDIYMTNTCQAATSLQHVCGGSHYGLAVLSDGSVLMTGTPSVDEGQGDVTTASGAVMVATDSYGVVCLQSSGMVKLYGKPLRYYDQQHGVHRAHTAAFQDWGGVAQVFGPITSSFAFCGLRHDGSVALAAALDSTAFDAARGWSDIVHIALGGQYSSGSNRILGVTAGGSVQYAGQNLGNPWEDVGGWTGIVQAAVTYRVSVGLKSDGTVVYCGSDSTVMNSLAAWPDDIKAIFGNGNATVLGLREDGSVVTAGLAASSHGTPPGNWRDVVQLSGGNYHCMGRSSCKCYACSNDAHSILANSIETFFDYCL